MDAIRSSIIQEINWEAYFEGYTPVRTPVQNRVKPENFKFWPDKLLPHDRVNGNGKTCANNYSMTTKKSLTREIVSEGKKQIDHRMKRNYNQPTATTAVPTQYSSDFQKEIDLVCD